MGPKNILFCLLLIAAAVLSGCSQKPSSVNTETINKPIEKKLSVKKQAEDLFTYLSDEQYTPPDNDPAIIEARKINVKIGLLADPEVENININLFDGHNYQLKKQELPFNIHDTEGEASQEQFVWAGQIVLPDNTLYTGASVTFVINGDLVTGNIPAVIGQNDFSYKIRYNEEQHYVAKIDQQKYGDD